MEKQKRGVGRNQPVAKRGGRKKTPIKKALPVIISVPFSTSMIASETLGIGKKKTRDNVASWL